MASDAPTTHDAPWSFSMDVLPGSPDEPHLAQAFELLLGDPGMFEARRLGDVMLDMGDQAAFLAEHYPHFQARTQAGHPMFVYGPGESYVLVHFSLRADAGGHVSGYFPDAGEEPLLERISTLAGHLEAPFTSVHCNPRDASIDRRSDRHRELLKDRTGRQAFPFWVKWGLPGIAYRSLFGRPFVDLIGLDRFATLPPDVAWPREKLWVVAGSPSAGVWTFDPMCAQERRVIDHLGPQYFFDVETGALPTELPDVPQHVSLPVTIRDPATGELTNAGG